MRKLITEDLEEPQECGLYLISNAAGKPLYAMLRIQTPFDSNEWFDQYNSPLQWEKILEFYALEDLYVESLAEHDARIRAEAWDEGAYFGLDADHLEDADNPYRTEES